MAKRKLPAEAIEFFKEQGAIGGKLSGAARMKKLTPEQRSEIGKKAVEAREAKRRSAAKKAPATAKKAATKKHIVALDNGNEYRCNECDAVIAPEIVQLAVINMESTSETCPHCGTVNEIDGFSKVMAYTCRHCGRGVAVDGD